MASEKKFEFSAVTPPPRRRASRGPTLPKEQLEAMLEVMKVKDEDGQYPWISNGETYATENKCSTQLLRWRKAFHQHGLVENTADISGTHYSTKRNPDTGEKKLDENGKEVGPFMFALKIKEDSE